MQNLRIVKKRKNGFILNKTSIIIKAIASFLFFQIKIASKGKSKVYVEAIIKHKIQAVREYVKKPRHVFEEITKIEVQANELVRKKDLFLI